jgi:hypothetical protein
MVLIVLFFSFYPPEPGAEGFGWSCTKYTGEKTKVAWGRRKTLIKAIAILSAVKIMQFNMDFHRSPFNEIRSFASFHCAQDGNCSGNSPDQTLTDY